MFKSSVITAVGLFGLALYQLSQSDVPSAVQSVLTALAALGVGFNNRNHVELKNQLSRKGMI